jgi:hypothetical protein
VVSAADPFLNETIYAVLKGLAHEVKATLRNFGF